jgi:hypothetical protein
MAPVGAVLIALDVPPLRRRLRGWIDRHRRKPTGPKNTSAKDGSV